MADPLLTPRDPGFSSKLSTPRRIKTQAAEALYASYTSFIRRTVEVMGSEQAAREWLDTPNEDFQNLAPLVYANERDFDLREFEPYFVRLEHGIYS
jgi:uncharacterized protein (DUF2384 family)